MLLGLKVTSSVVKDWTRPLHFFFNFEKKFIETCIHVRTNLINPAVHSLNEMEPGSLVQVRFELNNWDRCAIYGFFSLIIRKKL